MLDSRAHYLYRLYDRADDLLYIGITVRLGQRWEAHMRSKPWWPLVARTSAHVFPDRPAVLAAERDAIEAEHPRYNVQHNQQAHRAATAGVTAGVVGCEEMPDACHDDCADAAIYFPYAWLNGVGTYECANQHTWTCTWGHRYSGWAPGNRGRRQDALIDAADAAAMAEVVLADALAGQHMPDGCDDCRDGTIYYPFKWRSGIGRYLCSRGHRWTCSWGHEESGYGYANMGRPQAMTV